MGRAVEINCVTVADEPVQCTHRILDLLTATVFTPCQLHVFYTCKLLRPPSVAVLLFFFSLSRASLRRGVGARSIIFAVRQGYTTHSVTPNGHPNWTSRATSRLQELPQVAPWAAGPVGPANDA